MIPNKNPVENKKHVAFHLALLACQAATFFWSLKLRKLVLLSCTCCTFNPAHTRTSSLRYIGIPEPSETEVLLTSDTWKCSTAKSDRNTTCCNVAGPEMEQNTSASLSHFVQDRSVAEYAHHDTSSLDPSLLDCKFLQSYTALRCKRMQLLHTCPPLVTKSQTLRLAYHCLLNSFSPVCLARSSWKFKIQTKKKKQVWLKKLNSFDSWFFWMRFQRDIEFGVDDFFFRTWKEGAWSLNWRDASPALQRPPGSFWSALHAHLPPPNIQIPDWYLSRFQNLRPSEWLAFGTDARLFGRILTISVPAISSSLIDSYSLIGRLSGHETGWHCCLSHLNKTWHAWHMFIDCPNDHDTTNVAIEVPVHRLHHCRFAARCFRRCQLLMTSAWTGRTLHFFLTELRKIGRNLFDAKKRWRTLVCVKWPFYTRAAPSML